MKNTTETLKAVAPLLLILLLSFFTVKFGISKVSELNVKIQKEVKSQNTLNQKLRLLSAVSASINNDTGTVANALPDSNPALSTISQLKFLTQTGSLTISGIKAGAEIKDNSGLLRTDIVFEIDGPESEIIKFINSVNGIAPLTIVDKIKISQIVGVTKANITVKSFWSPLPKTLPSVSSELTGLTESEEKTLNQVNALIQPQFLVGSESSVNGDRQNPFIQ